MWWGCLRVCSVAGERLHLTYKITTVFDKHMMGHVERAVGAAETFPEGPEGEKDI